MRAFLTELTALSLLRTLTGLMLPEGEMRGYADLFIGLTTLLCMLHSLRALFTAVLP